MELYLQAIQNGIDVTLNVDSMPEWRLDEMAWELNTVYDYSADIESKRRWIREATALYASYGTVEAVYNYLSGYFDIITVEESWEYGGEPYHFRVIVDGQWDASKIAWARQAIEATKNVRSVLDELNTGTYTGITIHAETSWTRFRAAKTGTALCGMIPPDVL